MRAPDWWPIARWEFLKILKRKDFYISLLLTPVFLVGGGAVAALIGKMSSGQQDRLAIVWMSGASDTLVAQKRVVWSYPQGAAAHRDSLRTAMLARELDGAALVPPGFAQGEPVELLMRRDAPRLLGSIESALRRVARAQRASRLGLDTSVVATLDDSVRMRAGLVSATTGSSRAEKLTALGLLLLFFFVHIVMLSYMMTGVSAEKSHRITEVIVSAVSPQTWIDGKLVAYVGLGLVQAVVYLASGLGCALLWRFELPPIASPLFLFTALSLTVLGLVFYSALSAAVMATLKDLQTTQSMNSLFIWLPFLSVVFIGPAIDQPDARWLIPVSMFPPFSPILTPVRMALGGVAAWEAIATVALMAVAAWWMRGVAGHAFRVAMLMYGKDITLPELVRWSRER